MDEQHRASANDSDEPQELSAKAGLDMGDALKILQKLLPWLAKLGIPGLLGGQSKPQAHTAKPKPSSSSSSHIAKPKPKPIAKPKPKPAASSKPSSHSASTAKPKPAARPKPRKKPAKRSGTEDVTASG